jgi:hypothetical protein
VLSLWALVAGCLYPFNIGADGLEAVIRAVVLSLVHATVERLERGPERRVKLGRALDGREMLGRGREGVEKLERGLWRGLGRSKKLERGPKGAREGRGQGEGQRAGRS